MAHCSTLQSFYTRHMALKEHSQFHAYKMNCVALVATVQWVKLLSTPSCKLRYTVDNYNIYRNLCFYNVTSLIRNNEGITEIQFQIHFYFLIILLSGLFLKFQKKTADKYNSTYLSILDEDFMKNWEEFKPLPICAIDNLLYRYIKWFCHIWGERHIFNIII